MALARLEQALGPQQAADVVGAIGWRGAVHGWPPDCWSARSRRIAAQRCLTRLR
jgi:hypothetical protein